jgi:hypothetical protein
MSRESAELDSIARRDSRANALRFQAVGKKRISGVTRTRTPLWCRISGEKHDYRARFRAHEYGARIVGAQRPRARSWRNAAWR